MDKYLFTDGTNGVREVQSKEELDLLIQSSYDPDRIRIWVFNTSEWLSYADFKKRSAGRVPAPPSVVPLSTPVSPVVPTAKSSKPATKWLRKAAIAVAVTGTILLIYNFTRVTWTSIEPLDITNGRPANSPLVNADSLIAAIEISRGQKLDKITKTNLRIRNIWPERLVLQLKANRDSSRAAIRLHDVQLSVENSTGYLIDEAVVELKTWEDKRLTLVDTFHFRNVNYAMPAVRSIQKEYRADSIAVSFSTIKAKSFNFCYSATKESNYGNFNDRWFCK